MTDNVVTPEYLPGQREHSPKTCWKMLKGGKMTCILERGHDGGKHEPDRAAASGSGETDPS